MSFKKPLLLAATLILALAFNVIAQDDKFGEVTDTVYFEPYQIDAKNWAVNISLFNDEEIMAMSIPMTFSSSKTRLVADSTIFKGGIVEQFRVKQARVDTATQCLTIGLINDVGVSVPPIPPGHGRVATVFVSSLDDKEIKSLYVDTTTTPPGNNLQLVTPPSNGIIPAFVVREVDKPKTKAAEEK